MDHWRPLGLFRYCVFPNTLAARFTRYHQIVLYKCMYLLWLCNFVTLRKSMALWTY